MGVASWTFDRRLPLRASYFHLGVGNRFFCARSGADCRDLCQGGGAEMLPLNQCVTRICAGAGDNGVGEDWGR